MLGKLAKDTLAQPVIDIYNQLENDLLIEIAKRLSGKNKLLKEDPEVWKLNQLQSLGMLDKENLNKIKKLLGITSAQLNQLLYDASLDGMKMTDDAMMKAVKDGAHLKVPLPVSDSPIILNILKAYQDQAISVANLTNMTMVKQAKSIYIDVVNRAVTDVISGSRSPDQALRKVLGTWAENGVPALIDKAGKKWGPEGYMRMVITTTTHNTVHAMQDKRFEQWGCDLVEVSSHMGARPLCAPYQGKIFKISGADTKYKNLYTDTSYGQAAGLFGINCHHIKYPFLEGFSTQRYFPYPEEANDKAYNESQIQRAHERGIRKAKTRLEMMKAMDDQEGIKEAKALVKKRSSNLQDFIDETGRTRRRNREQIIIKGNNKPLPNSGSIPAPTNHKDEFKNPAKQDHIPQKVTKQEKNVKVKLMDQVTFNLKGKETIGKVIGKNGDYYDILHGDNKVHEAHKSSITNNLGKAPDKAPDPVKKVTPKVEIKTEQPKEEIKVMPKKSIDEVNVGDKILFKDKNGNQLRGTIQNKWISGSYGIFGDNGNPYKIIKDDIIDHIPEEIKLKKVMYDDYVRLTPDSPDIQRDNETFMKMKKRDVHYVRKYTTNYYSEMNGYLRTGSGRDNSTLVKEVNELQRVLRDNSKPFSENTILFRRFGTRAVKTIFGDEVSELFSKAEMLRGDLALVNTEKIKDKLVGGLLEDKAFVSSTYHEGTFGSSFDINVQIYCPKGYKNGMFVEEVSEYGRHSHNNEKEYLFNANMKFKIQDIIVKDGKITLLVSPE
jgi:hypothetical protein